MKIGVCQQCKEETRQKAIKSFNQKGTLQPENASCTGGYIVEIPYTCKVPFAASEGEIEYCNHTLFHGEYVDVNYCVKCGKQLITGLNT